MTLSIYSLRSGKLVRNVASLDGENMRGRGSTDCPDDWERMRWDSASRCWVEDAATAGAVDQARIDAAYRCKHGDGAKREGHVRKAIEAHLFLALDLPAVAPMLAAEAVATGVPLSELAAVVAAKDAEWIARETERRASKKERKSDA